MEDQFENFLSYADKKEELKTYITNKINDAMQSMFGLRYIRIGLIDKVLYENDLEKVEETGLSFDLYKNPEVEQWLENGLYYTIVNRKDLPGFSFMDCQFYYDEKLRKVYLYYVLDPNNRWGRHDLVLDMYKKINETIHKDFYKDQVCEVEILGPSELVDHSECNSGNADILSKYTVSYWKLFEGGRYYFINDASLVLKEKFRIFLTYGTRSFNNFRNSIVALNNRFDAFINPEDIPEGFEAYSDLCDETFEMHFEPFDQNEVVEFHLMNYTDYSFIDEYLIRLGGK